MKSSLGVGVSTSATPSAVTPMWYVRAVLYALLFRTTFVRKWKS